MQHFIKILALGLLVAFCASTGMAKTIFDKAELVADFSPAFGDPTLAGKVEGVGGTIIYADSVLWEGCWLKIDYSVFSQFKAKPYHAFKKWVRCHFRAPIYKIEDLAIRRGNLIYIPIETGEVKLRNRFEESIRESLNASLELAEELIDLKAVVAALEGLDTWLELISIQARVNSVRVNLWRPDVSSEIEDLAKKIKALKI